MTDEEWIEIRKKPMEKYKAKLFAMYAVIGIVSCIALVFLLWGVWM